MLKYGRQFLLMLILLGSIGICFGQENVTGEQGYDITLYDSELSLFYERGPVLIYDCISKHWVCTGEIEQARSLNERKFSILENEDRLPCAPIKKFSSDIACIKKQIELVNLNVENRFCMHPKLREQYRTY